MNESIDLECPRCRQRLRVPAEFAGKHVSCPDCGHGIEVPGPTGITESAPAPRSLAPAPAADPYADSDPYGESSANERDRYPDIGSPIRRPAGSAHGVLAPAIVMLIVACIGLLLNLVGCGIALGPERPVDPQAPPLVQELLKGGQGPMAASIQGFFALLSLVTIFGSIQMMRSKTWGLGLAASILSMLNFGNCVCFIGLPVGIWAMVALVNQDAKEAFS